MSKHTPGPWALLNGYDIFSELGADSGDGYKAPENDGWMIATVELGSVINDDGETIEIGHGVARANAHLIAAAPELFEALDKLANGYSGCRWDTGLVPRIEMAKKALAKARGES